MRMNLFTPGPTKRDWEIQCRSDLRQVGTSEDGEPVIREFFYFVLTNARGDRYRSVREERSELALSFFKGCVISALQRGASPVGSARWFRIQPEYGSEAYVEYGEAEEVAIERKESEEV